MLGDFWKWGRRVGEVLGTTILLTCSPERVSWLPFPTSPEGALSLRPVPHWSITGSPLLHTTLHSEGYKPLTCNQSPPQQTHPLTQGKEAPGSASRPGTPGFPAGLTPSVLTQPTVGGAPGSSERVGPCASVFPSPQWVQIVEFWR